MRIQVRNKIDVCNNGVRLQRPWSRITHIIIHRIGKELGTTVEELAEAFRDTSTPYSAGSYTGGRFPYTFYIDEDGEVSQTLEITDIGWHARRWSRPGIGVALSGDFRKHAVPLTQWDASVSLCALLAYWMRIYELRGHTEASLPGSTIDPTKECPGAMMDMEEFRKAVDDKCARATADLDKTARDMILGSFGITI